MKRLILLLLLFPVATFAQITGRTGSCSAATTSCTLSAVSTGDLIVVFAYRNASATAPSLPASNTSVFVSSGGTTNSYRVYCRKASSGADTGTGTATNATFIAAAAYTGTNVGTTGNCNTTGIGGTAQGQANSGTASYTTLTMTDTDASSWVLGMMAGDSSSVCTPSGMTQVTATGQGQFNDTNAGVSSWATTTCSVTSEHWRTATVELIASLPSSGATPTYADNGHGCPNNIDAQLATAHTCPLPNGTGTGNLIIVTIPYYDGTSNFVTSVTDDKSNVYVQAVRCDDTTNTLIQDIWYAQNAIAGAHTVTANFANTGTFNSAPAVFEYYNVATRLAVDTTACKLNGSGTGSTVTATGTSITPAATGELLVYAITIDAITGTANTGPCPGCPIFNWAKGTNSNITWQVLQNMAADEVPAAFQYGVYNSTSAITPQISIAQRVSTTTVHWVAAEVFFKPLSAGTNPTGNAHVSYVQSDNTDLDETQTTAFTAFTPVHTNDTVAVAFLSGGNSDGTITCPSGGTADTDVACSITDTSSDTWAQIGTNVCNNSTSAGGTSQGGCGQFWYTKGVTGSADNKLSWVMHPRSGGGHGRTFMTFSITGADASSPLDTSFGTSGLASAIGTQAIASGGGINTWTASPTTTNCAIISFYGAAFDTATGQSSPTGATFISSTYAGQPEPSHVDENNYWGTYYPASTSSITWTVTHNTVDHPGADRWIGLGVAFKFAPNVGFPQVR